MSSPSAHWLLRPAFQWASCRIDCDLVRAAKAASDWLRRAHVEVHRHMCPCSCGLSLAGVGVHAESLCLHVPPQILACPNSSGGLPGRFCKFDACSFRLMTNCACDQDSLLTKVRDDPHSSFMTQIHPAARFMPGHHQLKGAWKCWDGAASPGSASRRDGTGQEPARSPEPQSNELQDAASSAVLLVAK